MGTHAIVAVEMPQHFNHDEHSARYLSAYVHYDGRPSSMLPELETYDTAAKALGLIMPGGMSSISTTTTWEGEKRTTAQPRYYSERGEYSPATESFDFAELLEEVEGTGAEHLYVFNTRPSRQKGWEHHQKTQGHLPTA